MLWQMEQRTPCADTLDDQSIDALLTRARLMLKSLADRRGSRRPSPKTLIDYRRRHSKAVSMIAEHGIAMRSVLPMDGSFTGFRKRRSAVRFFEGLALQEAIGQLEVGLLEDTPLHQRIKLIGSVTRSLGWLLDCEQQPELLRLPRRRRSHALSLLPDRWQETLIQRAPTALRTAARILALTGCRAEELRRGVSYRINPSDHPVALEIIIRNAKNADATDPRFRTFHFKSGPDVNALIEELNHSADSSKADLFGANEGIFCAARLSERITRLALRIWPDRLNRPSSYSFRYAFRARLGKLGFTKCEIAEAMGHGSIDTQKAYGHQGYTPTPVLERSFSVASLLRTTRPLKLWHPPGLLQLAFDQHRLREHEAWIDRQRESVDLER